MIPKQLEKQEVETLRSEEKEIKPVVYTEAELVYRQNLIADLCFDRDEREKNHPEFDGMSYSEYYDSNKKADLSYIPPKKNKEDKRIVSGITHEKDNTLLSTLLNLKLESRTNAFDESDLLIAELGSNIEDLIRKSKEIEDWETKRPIIYREFIAQGDVFVEELWTEIEQVDRKTGWKPGDSITDAKIETKKVNSFVGIAESRMIHGKKVYLGNLKEEFIVNQPRVTTYEVVHRSIAEKIYGNWDRWENVPYNIDNDRFVPMTDNVYKDYNWNLTPVEKDYVGILKIQKKFSNEYMIMINGVMMLPVGYPLTNISPSGEYTITQGKLEPIPGFAYSKSQPSKTKVDQGIYDEFLRLGIGKTQQSFKPPYGSTTKKVIKRDVFAPATITYDIKKDQLFPLMENTGGVTAGEFSFFQLIKNGIDEKSINKTFEGGAQNGDVTATQIENEQNQQMMKLGLSVDGIVNLEKQISWLRIYTILCNYTVPIDTKVDDTKKNLVNIYRSFTVDATLHDGTKGKKIFEFKERDFPTPREQQKEEKDLSEKYGTPINKIYFDPLRLRNLKAFWFIQIIPTDKNNDKLSQLIFVQNVRQALEIFGPETLNLEYVKQRYANVIGEDPTKFFLPASIMDMMNQGVKTGGEIPTTNRQTATKPKMKAIVQ